MSLLAAERFTGSWELATFTRTSADGAVDCPLGAAPAGLISYTADATVAVQLFATDGQPGRLMPSASAYYGSFAVDEAKGEVIHHIEQASNDWLRATRQVRQYRFDDDRLTLSATVDGELLELVWQRRKVPA
ncbi:MAG: lipocalin-like domain-containing protein [Erythrobacter sp.]|nr:lipocalin-like domain-containing protein [Erythrobacter sp.]